MKNNRYSNLVETMRIQTSSYKTKLMQEFIFRQVEEIEGITAIYEGDENIYVIKGEAESYPCVVAHTDTVHDMVDNFQLFKSDDRLFSIDSELMERVGIGGDDKVGVFIALQVLRETDVCKVAFFRDEEVGCDGSSDAWMGFFDDVEFVLQCDRQGISDTSDAYQGVPVH